MLADALLASLVGGRLRATLASQDPLDRHFDDAALAIWNGGAPGVRVVQTRPMESSVNNTATVKAIYEAFGRGDVATILDKLDDAVEWETTVPVSDVPWLQSRRGKANVVGFFESMAPLKISRFEPHTTSTTVHCLRLR